MASHLTNTEFQIGTTQTINGVSTMLNNSDTEVPTSKAVRDYIDNKIPVSLTVSGNWTNVQGTSLPVDTTGLTFTVTYKGGTTASVTPSIRPLVWSDTIGTQTATFYYTEYGVTVSASKSASVVDPLSIPLTLYARDAGNVSITKTGDPGTIYYSKNGGSQTVLDSGVNISVVAGDKVSFYRTLSNHLTSDNYFTINCTNNCYVYGNVMSLYNKDNFVNSIAVEYNFAFDLLFYNNDYIDINKSVGELLLPAAILSADSCYSGMFRSCSNLTTAPTISATTVSYRCCSGMFMECSSLTTAPILPATTLANNCYENMFSSCTSLTTAPILPATTLATSCYQAMFYGCTSLNTAPSLPATTLVERCYSDLFGSCSSLTSITCLATNTSATKCTDWWVAGVPSSGTFTTPSSTSWTTGMSGIPDGWTRVNS